MVHKIHATALAALLLSCILLAFSAHASSESNLSLGGCGQEDKAYLALLDTYPDMTVSAFSNIYLSTDEIINAFLCNEFPFDAYVMNSSSFDYNKMINKGYCGELTKNTYLWEEVEKMLPSIQYQIIRNDDLYGIPVTCDIQYYAYNHDAWIAAGLSESDVPSSFEEYLDFLECWLDRIQINPEYEISVCNTFDSELYGPHSYTLYLVDMLLTNHIMQSNYAGEPLRFDTPVFRSLLLRCQEIGEKLYVYEPHEKGYFALFDVRHGMRELSHLVPLRLTSEQPVLVKATLHTVFLNSSSEEKEIATQYIENCLLYLDAELRAYIYSDAHPIENPQYIQLMEILQQSIQSLKEKLSDKSLSALERNSIQEKLNEKEARWSYMSESEDRYIISENDLENYHLYSDCLYFQAPSVFDPATEEGMNVRQLRDRFCMGDLTAEQLIKELDDFAWMLEMESP